MSFPEEFSKVTVIISKRALDVAKSIKTVVNVVERDLAVEDVIIGMKECIIFIRNSAELRDKDEKVHF